LIDSQPLQNRGEGETFRYISSLYKKKLYGKYISSGTSVNKYKNNDDIAVRSFIKGLLNVPPLFNIPQDAFLSRSEIIDFIKSYNPELKYTENSISKYRGRDLKISVLSKTKESESFVRYVKERFSGFDEESFYSMSYPTIKKNRAIEVKS
jgi:hypothetical protein